MVTVDEERQAMVGTHTLCPSLLACSITPQQRLPEGMVCAGIVCTRDPDCLELAYLPQLWDTAG